jgi:phosphate acetyltransferase
VARSLYITAMGPSSGKSMVTLGVMELLSRRVGRVGFFRPVIRAGEEPDGDIELVRTRYKLDQEHRECFALTSDDVRSAAASGGGASEAVLKTVLARYKAIEHDHDFVLCEGTDFTGVSAPLEFEFNAMVAGTLGCPVLVVVNGHGLGADEVLGAVAMAEESIAPHATVLAVVVNRVPAERLAAVRGRVAADEAAVPVWVVPEEPLLRSPTLAELDDALGAEVLLGEPKELNRVVRHVKVAAMSLPNLLDHVQEDTLLITPGDRADVIFAAFLSRQSVG